MVWFDGSAAAIVGASYAFSSSICSEGDRVSDLLLCLRGGVEFSPRVQGENHGNRCCRFCCCFDLARVF